MPTKLKVTDELKEDVVKQWGKSGGKNLIRKKDIKALRKLVFQIAKSHDISPRTLTKVLKETGMWTSGSWALWQYECTQQHNKSIDDIWNSVKDNVRNDWTLCETIDDLTEQIGSGNAYITLNALADSGKIKLQRGAEFSVYARYKYAKLALDLIKEKGPKTTTDVARKFHISERVASYALNMLHENGLVQRYSQGKRSKPNIFYVSGQEARLRRISPGLQLEDYIFDPKRPYITVPMVTDTGFTDSGARNILDNYARQGRLVRIESIRKPIIYAALSNGNTYDSIRIALKAFFPELLAAIGNGTNRHNIKEMIGGRHECLTNRLKTLQQYNIVAVNDKGRYYLTDKSL